MHSGLPDCRQDFKRTEYSDEIFIAASKGHLIRNDHLSFSHLLKKCLFWRKTEYMFRMYRCIVVENFASLCSAAEVEGIRV